MILTVLWEDQRGVEAKGFGPHDLLLACLSDELDKPKWELARTIQGHPKKGNGGVRNAIKRDGARLSNRGPVVAVLDRDRVLDLWKHDKSAPPECMKAIQERLHEETGVQCEIVFLIENVESLIDAVCQSLGLETPTKKPNPQDRDNLLKKAHGPSRSIRDTTRSRCQSFDRLVRKVVAEIQTWEPQP